MSEINLSAGVRQNLLALQNTADLLTRTQDRLATGNKVNSALDDPNAFFTAAALNDRASDLSALLDAQGQAIQVVEAADQGITAITGLVESARAIANQALGTDNAAERANFAAQYDDILDQIEDLAEDASFNGTNLLDSLNSQDLQVIFNEDGTSSLTVEGVNFSDVGAADGLNLARAGATGVPSTGTIDFASLDATQTLTLNTGAAGALDETIDLSTIATGGTPSAPASVDLDLSAGDFDDGDTLSFSVAGGAAIDITVAGTGGADPTATEIAAAINADATLAAAGVTADAGTGRISSANGDLVVSDTSGTTGTLGDTTAGGGATAFTPAVPGTLDAASVAAAIDGLTNFSATVVGGNIDVSVIGGNFTADNGAGNGVAITGTGFVPGGNDFATNPDINATLAAIDTALGTLRSTATALGTNLSTIQIRQDFTENLINTLEVGASLLTLADTNEEGANLLTLQTRQQLASTSLSFATQADQAVLALF